MNISTDISRKKFGDYLILGARVLLAWTFFRYGYGKLTDGQFGVSPAELSTPLKDLSLFKLSWYLFDHQPFKAFIGISQIICALLLIINRTVIIGAFMFLPIVTTILVIDLTFMPPELAKGFAWRLSFYIVLDLIILWHYKEKMKIIWSAVWQSVDSKFKYPVWAYLLLPLLAVSLEIIGILPHSLYILITNPEKLLKNISSILSQIVN